MRYCMMKSFVLKHALHLCIYSFEIWYTQRIFCNKIRHLSRLLCLDKARSIHLCQTFTPFSKKATQTEKLRKNFCAWNKQKNIFIYWYEIYVYRGSTHYMERRYCVGYVESTTSDYIYIYLSKQHTQHSYMLLLIKTMHASSSKRKNVGCESQLVTQQHIASCHWLHTHTYIYESRSSHRNIFVLSKIQGTSLFMLLSQEFPSALSHNLFIFYLPSADAIINIIISFHYNILEHAEKKSWR